MRLFFVSTYQLPNNLFLDHVNQHQHHVLLHVMLGVRHFYNKLKHSSLHAISYVVNSRYKN